MNEIIDISHDFGTGSSFGGGIELLMNDKKIDNSNSLSSIDIEDLNNLEAELNDLSNTSSTPMTNSFQSGLFGIKIDDGDSNNVRFSDEPSIHIIDESSSSNSSSSNFSSGLGHSTSNTAPDTKTWDGYGKFNDIPINPDRKVYSSEPKMSSDELLREKFKYLRKLESLEKKGVELTKKYNMDSNLEEMKGEYEMIMEEKSKQNSVKFQGNMMMAIINGIEFLNGRFDPFDIKLDGWSDQISENINDYDDIFGELHEKYKSKATLAPELKLLFQLGGSAMMVHMSNTMFKSAMPGMDDILRQNPDLMRQFQDAAVNSMSGSNPGLSGFMSGLMGEPQVPNGRGPPAPIATSSSTRSNQSQSTHNTKGMFVDDGISVREMGTSLSGNGNVERSSRRPDMRGPSDLSDILSGLKTKTLNVSEMSRQNVENVSNMNMNEFDNSTISVDDLKSLGSDSGVAKKSKRKPRSDKNTVSISL